MRCLAEKYLAPTVFIASRFGQCQPIRQTIQVPATPLPRSWALDEGWPGVPLHSARHTVATLLFELGVPEQTRMAILRNALATGTQGYTHIADREAVAAMCALDLLSLVSYVIKKPHPPRFREEWGLEVVGLI